MLALFVPLIISSGGNSGSQATTLVIRAMALGEVRLRDWWRVIRRELAAGLALGAILGAHRLRCASSSGRRRFRTYGAHYLLVALTVAVSLVGVVLCGTLAGSMLPFVLRRLGFDPASASAPFVATLVDVTGPGHLLHGRQPDPAGDAALSRRWICLLLLLAACGKNPGARPAAPAKEPAAPPWGSSCCAARIPREMVWINLRERGHRARPGAPGAEVLRRSPADGRRLVPRAHLRSLREEGGGGGPLVPRRGEGQGRSRRAADGLRWARQTAAEAAGGQGGLAYGLVLAWHLGSSSLDCQDLAVDLAGRGGRHLLRLGRGDPGTAGAGSARAALRLVRPPGAVPGWRRPDRGQPAAGSPGDALDLRRQGEAAGRG